MPWSDLDVDDPDLVRRSSRGPHGEPRSPSPDNHLHRRARPTCAAHPISDRNAHLAGSRRAAGRGTGRSAVCQSEEDHECAPSLTMSSSARRPTNSPSFERGTRGDLVDDQAAGHPQAVLIVGHYGKPNRRRLGRIGGGSAHGHGTGLIEAAISDDRRRTVGRLGAGSRASDQFDRASGAARPSTEGWWHQRGSHRSPLP